MNAGFAARGRRNRGRPSSRRGRRGRLATMILNDIQEVEDKKYLFLLFIAGYIIKLTSHKAFFCNRYDVLSLVNCNSLQFIISETTINIEENKSEYSKYSKQVWKLLETMKMK